MPAVARRGGQDTVNTGHTCDATTVTDVGSSNVFVNGYGVCRQGDAIQIHNIKVGQYCVPHTAVINTGSNSVYVNGKPIARNGDSTDLGTLTSGSSNVFAGTGTFLLVTEDGFQIITEDGFIYEGGY
jgi:uncharacterized Zn-binding protein involved in type VI secretion